MNLPSSLASLLPGSLSFSGLSLGDLPLALLGSTFATVFLAELGDKTQLAIVSISGTSNRPGAVFAGSSAALVLASLVGAAAGGSLSSLIPTDALQLAAAVGFLILGTRLILRSRSGEEAGEPAAEPAAEPATEPDGDSTAP